MTKLNDVSPGEWSMAHKKSMESAAEETAMALFDRRVSNDGVNLGRREGDLPDTEAMLDSPTQTQVGGDWYKNCAIQPIEFIMKNDLGFCEGNAIKYICRHEQKGGALDIDKAIHYLEMLKEDLYS